MRKEHKMMCPCSVLRVLLFLPAFLLVFPVLVLAQADLTLGQVACSPGGGGLEQILESKKEVLICVVLAPAENCQAILRELGGDSEEVIVQGEPQIACITAKKAAVTCRGEKAGGVCNYQVVSIDGVTNPLFFIGAFLVFLLLLLLLLWRAFGPFFRRE